jgi:4'-phosphopantetheinyl transferase
MQTFVSAPDIADLNITAQTRQVYLHLIDLNVTDERLPELRRNLTPTEQLAATDFYFERDRRRYIAGRAGLRQALASVLDIQPHAVEFCYGKFGKPELAKRGANWLHFNFSHSGDWALLALAAGRPVGVDIERVRSVPDMLTLVARFFSSAESHILRNSSPVERPTIFFRLWTCKEAFLKATGAGLQQPLNTITVEFADNYRTGWFRDSNQQILPYSLTILNLPIGYEGVVVLPN